MSIVHSPQPTARRRGFTKREWTLLTIALILFFGFCIDRYIRGVRGVLRGLDTEIAQEEKTLHRLRTTVVQSRDVADEYESIISNYADLKDSDTLLQQIEGIARKNSINLLNIKPTAVKDEGTHTTYSIRLESQEDITVFARFLHALTEDLQRIGVERVQINAQDTNAPPRIVLSLTAVAFKR